MNEERRLYCAQDSAVTAAVLANLLPRLAAGEVPGAQAIYDFERALQAPALAMSLRGVRVDRGRVAAAQGAIAERAAALRAELAVAGCVFEWGVALAPTPAQVKRELYDRRGLKPRISRDSGNPTTDDRALRALAAAHPDAAPLCTAVLALRGLDKDSETLERGIDADGRVRSTWNVGATEVDRFSSSKNPMRGGGNMQNVTKDLRSVFVPDPGWTMWQADLRCADSHFVALKSGDAAYIAAHETPGADPHTLVARLTWPTERWPEDDRAAEAYARTHAPAWSLGKPLRQHSKQTQHASNYLESVPSLAARLGLRRADADRVQRAYFGAFPSIPRWHEWCAERFVRLGEIRTAFGRTRQFFDRRGDTSLWLDSTARRELSAPAALREVVAFEPAHTTSYVCLIGMLRIWNACERAGGDVQLLANGHDALLGQVRAGREYLVAQALVPMMRVEVPVEGIDGTTRTLALGVEAKLGGDWKAVS